MSGEKKPEDENLTAAQLFVALLFLTPFGWLFMMMILIFITSIFHN